jgi:hypothetical protein
MYWGEIWRNWLQFRHTFKERCKECWEPALPQAWREQILK